MDGGVVQLVQGREKALDGDSPEVMLQRFAAFPQIQVIDLDAAMGRGANDRLVEMLASKAVIRAGGGVRTVGRAQALLAQGAYRVIVGTSAFNADGPNFTFLQSLVDAIGRERIVLALDSKGGRIVVKGWQEATHFTAEEVIRQLEPHCAGFLCTYVDKEGMMQGTDLDWFRRLRAATDLEITAAGGITTIEDIRTLDSMRIHSAVGMAIYTGRLDLGELAAMQAPLRPLNPQLVPLKLQELELLTTEAIRISLQPGQEGCLKVRPDGTLLDGHHRIQVLRCRGVDVDTLPREIIIKKTE
jgi:phosphoribosylformimino-5-aminoimidazole carboxamide ribonucleotide (ProFAR) isomerase